MLFLLNYTVTLLCALIRISKLFKICNYLPMYFFLKIRAIDF